MTTEIWFRNPHNYIVELAKTPLARKVIWDRGMLLKRAIDPVKHAKLWFANEPFEVLVIGEQGTAHLDNDHDMDNPKAVYPTWSYADDEFADLEEMVHNPLGDDQVACNTHGVPADELPIYGQEHRVFLIDMPPATTGTFKALMRNIQTLGEEYEGTVKFHLHNSYSYAAMFGRGMASADFDPRTDAAKGRVYLPNGKALNTGQLQRGAHWIAQLNSTPGELADPKERCKFNIRSAMWAAENYERDLKFTKKGDTNLDPSAKQVQSHPGARTVLNGAKEKPGDKIVCDSCSLQDHCQYYREGAVCTLPEAETSPLADYLGSRDASKLIDAMGTMLGAQAKRLEKAVKEEEEFGEYSPEVTKMINSLFSNTMKLTKVLDPSLTKAAVQVTVGAGVVGSISASSPQQVVANAMRALEDQGYERADITNELMQATIIQQTGAPMSAIGQK